MTIRFPFLSPRFLSISVAMTRISFLATSLSIFLTACNGCSAASAVGVKPVGVQRKFDQEPSKSEATDASSLTFIPPLDTGGAMSLDVRDGFFLTSYPPRLWDFDSAQPLASFLGRKGVLDPTNRLLGVTKWGSIIVELYDVSSAERLNMLKPREYINDIDFSPDGTLVLLKNDNAQFLWRTSAEDDEEGGTVLPGARVRSTEFLSPSDILVHYPVKSSLWNVNTGEETHPICDTGRECGGRLSASPDGRLLVSHDEGTIFSTGDLDLVGRLDGVDGDSLSKAAVDPTNQFVAGALNEDGRSGETLAVWNISQGHKLMSVDLPPAFSSLQFSGDGRYVLAVGENSVRGWQVESGVQTLDVTSEHLAGMASRHYWLLTVGDNEVLLRDIETGETVHRFEVKTPYDAAFSDDDTKIVTLAREEAVLWDTNTGQRLATTKAEDWLITVRFAPDKRTLIVDRKDTGLEVWDDKGERKESVVFSKQEQPIWLVDDLNDNGDFLVQSNSGVHIWNYLSDTKVKTLAQGHYDSADVTAMLNQDKSVAYVYDKGRNTTSAWTTRDLRDQGDVVGFPIDAAVAKDGTARLLVTANGDSIEEWVSLRNPSFAEPLAEFRHANIHAMGAAFIGSDSTIAVSFKHKGVEIWSPDGKTQVASLPHSEATRFSYDENAPRLLTISNSEVIAWNPRTWEQEFVLRNIGRDGSREKEQQQEQTDYAGTMERIGFSDDGKMIVASVTTTQSGYRCFCTWNADTGAPLFVEQPGAAFDVAYYDDEIVALTRVEGPGFRVQRIPRGSSNATRFIDVVAYPQPDGSNAIFLWRDDGYYSGDTASFDDATFRVGDDIFNQKHAIEFPDRYRQDLWTEFWADSSPE